MVWVETPTNPTLKVTDIAAVSKICKELGLILVVDNTFLTPYLSNPLDHGADIVIHSGSKYLAGHSDIVMGFVATNNDEYAEQLQFHYFSIGGVAGAFDSYLVLRSVKTLSIRMEAICKNAMRIAEFLEAHPKVEKIYYPGLKSSPYYELQKKQAKGTAGVISFVVKDGTAETSRTFLKSLKTFSLAESLGGVESLAECPALMTHANVPEEHRQKIGVVDGLIRIACGIENIEDLEADLENAFTSI